ncbi:AMP-binding protein [Saccharopolyspora endophytica]|uniref:AMP-binding protein n=1 Tax=Saccharopolyspora endophytica TaxID=543886 RepID=A0ABS5DH90_9PSEU|nr:AMP-binding protein [Saccharopolyspora endophytica]MBQ0925507.1 AMP-binding protein [Saccharopolyspora endophytica]
MPMRSPYPDVDVPDVSLTEFLFGTGVGNHAEATALVEGTTGDAMTFGQLHAAVEGVAAGLHAWGVRAGDVIALVGSNSPRWVLAFHSALRANTTVTTCNPLYTTGELANQLTDSGAAFVITEGKLREKVVEAAAKAGLDPDSVFTLDSTDGHTSLAELAAGGGEAPAPVTGAEGTAVLPYSSGTTGRAKGVVLTHRNLVANVLQFDRMVTSTRGSAQLAVLPLFHIYGMTVLMNHCLHTRAPLITMPRFDLAEMLRLVDEHRVRKLYVAPPTVLALAKDRLVDSYDLSSVEMVFSGAAPLDGDLGRALTDRLGCAVLQGYGMTEMSPVSHAIPEDRLDLDPASCGFALPGIEHRLVDPATGEDVGPGGRGELWVRGPNVMSGYLNNAEATAQTLDADGYLHTGDVATATPEGVITIVDRVKELIKYKGYQVPPAELEAVLLTHPAVEDAAVIGVCDARGEEVPKAFVVRSDGSALSADDVITYVADRIAPHKKVRAVEFVDAIPKSASGKILRNQLREAELRP